MQLSVPQRTVADTESFPIDPEGVSRWLAALQPMQSSHDAREVYRGLRHSNRLHNDVRQRRAVLASLIPVLRELHAHLMETCQAQPVPLTREFQRVSELVDGLLREEAFAFKILLADSDTPNADDISRAMQALSRRAETALKSYRKLPESLLGDAYQLYALAEKHDLLADKSSQQHSETMQHFTYILVLTLADTSQQRARQLPLLMSFLQQCANLLTIATTPAKRDLRSSDFVLYLDQDARAVPAGMLLDNSPDQVRWLDLAPVLQAIDEQIASTRVAQKDLLGVDSLERQSLARLRVTLARNRHRRLARGICYSARYVVMGHKSICADFRFSVLQSQAVHDSALDAAIKDNSSATDSGDGSQEQATWFLVNFSSQGARLVVESCHPGLVQVGELITIAQHAHREAISESGKSESILGVVRWVAVNGESSVHIGVEYLAKGVMPVSISRVENDDTVADDALIIACKVKTKVLQTMLLPPYLYQSGDQIIASLNGKSRRLELGKCLQSNGLFSHYSLADA